MSASIPANNAADEIPSASGEVALSGATKRSFDDKPALETKNRGLLMLAVMMVSIIQILDVTIANVALPHMQSSLGATLDTVSWVLTSYIIASVLVTPIAGWLSDIVGSRIVFIGATAGFLIASMLCGMATSLTQMVLFRSLQGACAAFIGPMSQTILLDINPPSKQASALSIWGLVVMVAPITGPTLGGFLTDTLNWRWVFYINVPIGIPTLAILLWLLPSRPLVARKLDLLGFGCLAVALGSLQLMLDRGQHKDWLSSREIVAELVITLSAFWVYFVHTMTTEKPLFPSAILKDRNFVGALGSLFMLGVANVAITSILPTMFQGIFGYTAIDTGLLMVPRALGMVITMTLGARLTRIIDARYLIAGGYLTVCVAMHLMSGWSVEIDAWAIISAGFIQGMGLGAVFTPINLLSFSTLDAQYRPDGASILNLMRNIGGSFGISIIVTLLARNQQISHADMASHITQSNVSLDSLAPFAQLGEGVSAVLPMINAEINRQAMMIAYIDNFYMLSFFIFCVALSVFFFKPMRIAHPQHVPMAE
ncbi:MAG TPA: DHA2 family efflux MFS transporter permease subunit [Spongiibacteraceae bacterium]|nr:DHA2 family efflux MFS transporter permease subunit [Spongiibacteraceae bacterium]